jgi:hypothetical protein
MAVRFNHPVISKDDGQLFWTTCLRVPDCRDLHPANDRLDPQGATLSSIGAVCQGTMLRTVTLWIGFVRSPQNKVAIPITMANRYP